jgi:hypothetical protein
MSRGYLKLYITLPIPQPAPGNYVASYGSAGFSVEGLQRVQQKTCDSLQEFAARMRLRADSTLILLSDAEFERRQSNPLNTGRSLQTPIM